MRFLLAALLAATLAVPAYATESAEATSLTGVAPIVDGSGNIWTFGAFDGANYQTLKNGVREQSGYGVLYYYHSHAVYVETAGGHWYNMAAFGTEVSDPRTGGCTHSVNGATVTSTSGSICDAAGVTWTLTTGTGLQVTKAGTKQGTADVVLMYYDNPNDRIYQQNSDGDWWYTAAAGTVSWIATVDPRVSANCVSTSWCDDFNGTALNADQHMNSADRWGYAGPDSSTWDGYAVNGAWMVNPLHTGTTGGTFATLYGLDGSGNLHLDIAPTPGGCTTACGNLAYISGQLNATTHKAQVGHYFEVRAKMPSMNGTNFALWLYADYHNSGGLYQEIDLVEAVRASDGSWSAATQAIHHDYAGVGNDAYDIFQAQGFDITQWHTYGVYWTSSSICLYIDRAQTICNSQSSAGYTGDMIIWLSSQAGASGWTGNIAAGQSQKSMLVDYWREYTYKPF